MKRLPFFARLRQWLRDAYTCDTDLDAVSDLALEMLGRRRGAFEAVTDALEAGNEYLQTHPLNDID